MNEPAHLAQAPAPVEPAAPPAEPPAAPAATLDAPPTQAPASEPPVAAPVAAPATATESQPQAAPPPTPAPEPDPNAPPVRVVPKVEEYVLPEGVPEVMAQFAYDNDFTQEQLNATMAQVTQYISANDQSQKDLLHQAGQDVVNDWGEKGQHNLSIVRRALKQNDPGGQLAKVLDNTGFGNHPAVLNFFLHLGTQLQEGGFLESSVHTPTGKKSAAQSMFGESHPSKQN